MPRLVLLAALAGVFDRQPCITRWLCSAATSNLLAQDLPPCRMAPPTATRSATPRRKHVRPICGTVVSSTFPLLSSGSALEFPSPVCALNLVGRTGIEARLLRLGDGMAGPWAWFVLEPPDSSSGDVGSVLDVPPVVGRSSLPPKNTASVMCCPSPRFLYRKACREPPPVLCGNAGAGWPLRRRHQK